MYPRWKKWVWRFGRVFLATFLAQVVVLLPKISDYTNWNEWWTLLILPALVASISALAKALRDYLGEGDYDNKIHKLPI